MIIYLIGFLGNWLNQDLSTFKWQNVEILLLLDFSAFIRKFINCSIALFLMFAFNFCLTVL